MSARLIRAAVFGSFIVLLINPFGAAAQTPDAQDHAAVVQTPATHQHDHDSSSDAVKTETGASCCAKMASNMSHDAGVSAPPAADQQPDVAKTPEKGCCGGMMNTMKKDQPMADQTSAKEGHSCCCSGMNGMKM